MIIYVINMNYLCLFIRHEKVKEDYEDQMEVFKAASILGENLINQKSL